MEWFQISHAEAVTVIQKWSYWMRSTSSAEPSEDLRSMDSSKEEGKSEGYQSIYERSIMFADWLEEITRLETRRTVSRCQPA